MPLTPGSRLGPYEISAQIGAGGMGEVYRATDTNLERHVAIKVLPEAVASDAERLARFDREAKTLASLSHPNIAGVYGLEKSAGTTALVMELIEGSTLADRVAQGAIPVEETLAIATQIGAALEAAHGQGIVHRDLKPANVKVRPDGTVKVLDFGLAKAMEPAASSPSASQAAALTRPAMTQAGMIVGTAAYMSPEQAKGQPVDSRTDIFAFGCVLYEMLAGRPSFGAESSAEMLAAVLRTEPDWAALPAETPPAIRRLLRRCLQKDRNRRLQTIGDARIEIEEVRAGDDGTEQPVTSVLHRQRRSREHLAWLLVGMLVVAFATALVVPYLRAPTQAPEMRFEIPTPASSDPESFAISPDGLLVVFTASVDGQERLWVRPTNATTAQPLPGTEGASYPFWSPDSRSIGFFAASRLKRIDIGGGLPEPLADASAPAGGAWGADGSIVFAPALGTPLFRVPAAGGDSIAVTRLDPPRQISHRFPQFLPDGKRFLFFVQGTPETQGLYLWSPDTPGAKRLTAADTAGGYVPPGWLLFLRQGTLVARRFDPARGELSGDPVFVADRVSFRGGPFFVGAFSTSATGLVAYRAAGTYRRQLTWFDRSGRSLGSIGAPDENDLVNPDLSPDGQRVAVQRALQNNTDIWLIDAARTTRFTFDEGRDVSPIWSPDGSRLVFSSNRKGSFDLHQASSSSAGSEQRLLDSPSPKISADWSPDGRYVLYSDRDPKTGPDLWALPLDGNRKPFVFLKTDYSELWGQFSPDGRWVAYQSDESGRHEIYVRAFPGPGGQSQVSTAGGVYPRWAAAGDELYYVAPDSRLMSVSITAKGNSLDAGTPVILFQTRIVGGGTNVVGSRQQYDVSADGRFLINVNTNETTTPITIVLNWAARVNGP